MFSFLLKTCAAIAAGLMVCAGGMLTYEVVARYFFTKPTIWAAELSQMCLIWGCMLAMAWLLAERRHIQVDAVMRLLPERVQLPVEGFAMLVVAIFSAVVTWYGFDIFLDSFVRGRTTGSMLNIPIWITELAIPVGFALLFVQSVIEVLNSVRGIPGKSADHLE